MVIRLSDELKKSIHKLKLKDISLWKKVNKQLAVFQSDPEHPSLRTHKLKGGLSDRWSVSISRSVRMLYLITETGEVYFFDLGTHDEVYQK